MKKRNLLYFVISQKYLYNTIMVDFLHFALRPLTSPPLLPIPLIFIKFLKKCKGLYVYPIRSAVNLEALCHPYSNTVGLF